MSEGAEATDGVLAERALAGDDAAFARLIGQHKNWAYRFIRRYVGSPDDAYDVLQDTFFAAWLALARYQRDQPFEFWLRRIALNKCRDRARRNRVRRVLEGVLGSEHEAVELPDQRPDPQAQTVADEELQRLERSLDALPRGLKEPLLLTALEGLSHKEAGELLGLNAKAVEMRIYRARARLSTLHGPRKP